MKEYKMRRGEHLGDRLPDLRAAVEDYFGPVADTEDYEGHEVYVVDAPANPVFERIRVGAGRYDSKKDTLLIEFEEADPASLDPDELEAAGEAVSVKNEFLLEATGRDAKSRRESMKRAVEDESPDV